MKQTLGRKPPRLKRRTPQERSDSEKFRMVVFHRAEGRSQVTGAIDYPMDCHHCVPQQMLKRLAPELLWDPDNAILLTRLEHTRHENRGTVISFEQLPEYVVRFAETHNLLWQLERAHPRRESGEGSGGRERRNSDGRPAT